MDYKEKAYNTNLLEFDEGVLKVTLNQPEMRNALTLEWMNEFRQILHQLSVDPEVKVLVITGAGQAFCAGGNIKEFGREPKDRTEAHPLNRPLWNIPTMSVEERIEQHTTSGKRIFVDMANLTKPSIAVINGTAAGAGFDIALACDLRYIAEDAKMISSFVNIGIIPIDGGLWYLSRIVGMTRAYEIMYSGNPIKGTEVERIGLANKALPKEELMNHAMGMAKKLAKGPSISYQLIKHYMRKSMFIDLPEAFEEYYKLLPIMYNTHDHKEAVQAFLEKRDAHFTGM